MYKVLGCGSPVVDFILVEDEAWLKKHWGTACGSVEFLSPEIRASFAHASRPVIRRRGGATANTVNNLLRLGVHAELLGKLGDDPEGEFFLSEELEEGLDTALLTQVKGGRTACCAVLVTPENDERTMASDLGVSIDYSPSEMQKVDYSGFDLVMTEGFFAVSPGFAAFCQLAHEKSRLFLDVSNFRTVEKFHREFSRLWQAGSVDILCANQLEAAALCGEADPERALHILSRRCQTVIVKMGAAGAWIAHEKNFRHVPPVRVEQVVDTTGAGDAWAAGFLAGLSRNLHPFEAASLGAETAALAVVQLGALIPREKLRHLC